MQLKGMRKTILIKIRKCCLPVKLFMLYIALLISAYVLLCIVYALPIHSMCRHVEESKEVFENEGEYPRLIMGHYNTLLKSVSGLPENFSVNMNTQLDNFTDALMLLEASFESKYNPFVAAVLNEHADINGKSPVETLTVFGINGISEYNTATYGRYWHGYQVFLKPLLLFFNYQEIRYIIMAVQISLLVCVVAMFAYKHNCKEIVPLVCAYLFLNPAALFLSLQYHSVWILTLIQFVLFLYYDRKYEKDRRLWIYHFFIIGCLTCFFDFLTYPLVTMGITAGYLVFRYCKEVRDSIISLVNTGMAWGIGYVLMWAGKWVIGGIISGTNIFAEAIFTIKERASYEVAENTISYLEVLAKNIYVGYGSLLCVSVFVTISVIIAIFCKIKFWNKIIVFLICALFPFAWYMIAANHSYVHAFFSYRELAITVYALCSLFVGCYAVI